MQGQLVEVVLDLGRPVLARYSHGDEMLSSAPLSSDELFEVVAKVQRQPSACQALLAAPKISTTGTCLHGHLARRHM